MKQGIGFVERIAKRTGMALVMLLCSVMATGAFADPPGRVGRLADITGQVWLYSPDAGEWITAVRNRPLTTGDRISTDAGARAEVRIGSTTVRLDSGTELEVLAIDDEQVSLQLHSGSVAARLRDAEAAREFELKTTEGRFQVQRAGAYRFDRSDASSDVTVWKGQALYEGPGSALTVNANQRAEFWIDRNNAAQYSISEPEQDPFATWNGERDRQDDRTASTRYVSPEMTGVEDLDRHGRWEQAPEYGHVWIPRSVPRGWAPYGAGHWTWVSPWGWTWVDDQPWGFAPFHYGRWVMIRDRWCWAPGTYVRRPVYAPALVGWVGGPNLSVSINIGGGRRQHHGPAVGWFPLAPREVYVPTYRVSPRYVKNVNVTHVTNITNVTTIINSPQTVVNNTHYANRRHHHAVTVVPQSVLASRQPVGAVAAQLRETREVRELATQPLRKAALAAPPVSAPPVPVAVQEQRRRHHEAMQQRGRDAERVGGSQPRALPESLVPPAPGRVAHTGQARGEHDRDRRGRDRRDEARQVPVAQPAPALQPGQPGDHRRVLTNPPATVAPPIARIAPIEEARPAEAGGRQAPAPQVVPPAPSRTVATPPAQPSAVAPLVAAPVPEHPGRQRGTERPQNPREPVGGRAPQPDPNAAAQARAQHDALVKAQHDAQAKVHAQQEAQAKAHAQQEAQAKAQAQQDAQAKAAQAQQQAQVRAQAQQQAQARAHAQQEAQAKAHAQQEAQARAHAQQEAQAKAQAHARAQHDAQVRAAQHEAQARAQAQAKAQAKEEEKQLRKGPRDDRRPETQQR